jgi:hypothetical protein
MPAELNAGAPVHGDEWRGRSPASAWWSICSGPVSLGGPATGGWRGAVGLAVAPFAPGAIMACVLRFLACPSPGLLVLALPHQHLHVGLATLIITFY